MAGPHRRKPPSWLEVTETVDGTDITREVRAIRSVFQSWYRAMEGGDIAGLLLLVTPDVIVKAPGSPPIIGRSALGKALSTFLEAYSETVNYEVEEVEVSGQLAFARISERATILPRSGESASSINGMHLTILRRQPDGRWLVARDVSSLMNGE